MIQGLDTFMSKHDLESGSRWSLELSKQLEETNFGIIFLSSENLNSQWILFESGALTKHIEGRACSILIGELKPTDVTGPLSQFQNRTFQKEEIKSVLSDINKKLQKPLEIQRLDMVFEKWWPDLEKEYKEAISSYPNQVTASPRDQRDMIEELLTRIRNIERVCDERKPLATTLNEYVAPLVENLTDYEKKVLYEIAHSTGRNTSDYPDDVIDGLLRVGILLVNSSGALFLNEAISMYIRGRYKDPLGLIQV